MEGRCARCNQPFEIPSWMSYDEVTSICGDCADDLRSEEEAYVAQMQAQADDEAYARYCYEQERENYGR